MKWNILFSLDWLFCSKNKNNKKKSIKINKLINFIEKSVEEDLY